MNNSKRFVLKKCKVCKPQRGVFIAKNCFEIFRFIDAKIIPIVVERKIFLFRHFKVGYPII